MRTIKFRAWDIGQGGHMLQWGELQRINYNRNWDNKRGDVGWWNDPDFTLMQFTGLHDRNGKEIYEGDIVRHVSTGEHRSIVFKDGGFRVMCSDGDSWPLNSTRACGLDAFANIHENPELLEAKQ